MLSHTSIEWTECTWNPVTGCSKTSLGCQHCYAERMALRLKAMGQPNYVNGFEVTCHEHMLTRPLEIAKPRMIFVNSMSDLFHEAVPTDFVKRIFHVMNRAGWHTFQVLTKRAQRLANIAPTLEWSSNIWMGVTVESDRYTERIELLRQTGACVKFVSCEPLLGPLPRLNLTCIDWVIVGGESGPGARPMRQEWVLDIRNQCVEVGVPFFFKQWGGTRKKQKGRVLEGRTWSQIPRPSPPPLADIRG